MIRIGLPLLFSLFSLFISAQNKNFKVEGIVFQDTNHNGKFDHQEKRLKKIPVSNGDTIVLTDRRGKFVLTADSTSSIFPILPSGFEITGSRIVNSNFYYLNSNSVPQVAFPLNRIRQNPRFRIGAIGDVQVSNRQEISYANNTIMAELASRTDLDFNIFLGDLVNDNIEDLFLFRQTLERLPHESWAVAGNHDRDEVIGQQQHTFNQLFGASDYSFNYADVHFLVLNNVYAKGKRGYEGRFTEKQLRFVKNDMALVSKDKLVVICQHIPMIWAKNKTDLLSLVDNREKILILSGHTHRVSRHYIAPNIMEIVTGASCGNWWTGERDWQGIPSALMQCGSPRNYFTINFNKNSYQFQFKGIGLDPAEQMSIWVSGQDTLDRNVPALENLNKPVIIANVFAGSDSTNTRMKIDEGEWISMEKVSAVAPDVERMVALNKMDVYPTKFSRKAALRSSNSSHIWQAAIPVDVKPGAHLIRIETTEPSGFKASGSSVFIR